MAFNCVSTLLPSNLKGKADIEENSGYRTEEEHMDLEQAALLVPSYSAAVSLCVISWLGSETSFENLCASGQFHRWTGDKQQMQGWEHL